MADQFGSSGTQHPEIKKRFATLSALVKERDDAIAKVNEQKDADVHTAEVSRDAHLAQLDADIARLVAARNGAEQAFVQAKSAIEGKANHDTAAIVASKQEAIDEAHAAFMECATKVRTDVARNAASTTRKHQRRSHKAEKEKHKTEQENPPAKKQKTTGTPEERVERFIAAIEVAGPGITAERLVEILNEVSILTSDLCLIKQVPIQERETQEDGNAVPTWADRFDAVARQWSLEALTAMITSAKSRVTLVLRKLLGYASMHLMGSPSAAFRDFLTKCLVGDKTGRLLHPALVVFTLLIAAPEEGFQALEEMKVSREDFVKEKKLPALVEEFERAVNAAVRTKNPEHVRAWLLLISNTMCKFGITVSDMYPEEIDIPSRFEAIICERIVMCDAEGTDIDFLLEWLGTDRASLATQKRDQDEIL